MRLNKTRASKRPIGIRLSRDLVAGFERGQHDFKRGVSRGSIPYADAMKANRWLAGWDFEKGRK